MGHNVQIKLVPLNAKVCKDGGFRAQLPKDGALDYTTVLEEVIKEKRLGLSPEMLKMMIDSTFASVIDNVYKDGRTRRLGDFLEFALELKGSFDSEGEPVDLSKHKLELSVRQLKGFRHKHSSSDLTPVNHNAGPKVVVERTYSAGCEDNEISWGKDIIIEGENLFVFEDENPDCAVVKYFCRRGSLWPTSLFLKSDWVSKDGKRLTIPWSELNLDQYLVKRDFWQDPIAVIVTLRTRGGKQSAKQQLHRARAYFDSWLKQYPYYRGTFSQTVWGKAIC